MRWSVMGNSLSRRYWSGALKGFSHFSRHSRLSPESSFSIATFHLVPDISVPAPPTSADRPPQHRSAPRTAPAAIHSEECARQSEAAADFSRLRCPRADAHSTMPKTPCTSMPKAVAKTRAAVSCEQPRGTELERQGHRLRLSHLQ